MVGNLKKLLGVVVVATIEVVATTIYFKDGTIFQDFANGSFKLPNGILFGNKQSKLVLDKTISNFQLIKGFESNFGFVQKIESDSQTHKI